MVLLFSLSGGLLSTLVMSFLYGKMKKVFSITGISMAGAVFHNIGQLAAAAFVMRELSVFSYLPVLLVSGIVAGFLIGLSGSLLVRTLAKAGIFLN
jgi:heptaprenyl diphosphate synthase